MKITLQEPKEITLIEKKVKTITTLTIDRVVDLSSQKLVRCFIEELNEPITLWKDEEYDEIGQWTDEDVEMRLKELFSSL